MQINNVKYDALIDSGSTDNFIHPRVVKQLSLTVIPFHSKVAMASSSNVKNVTGYVNTDIAFHGKVYNNLRLSILDNLCVDIILGLTFQTQHESVNFKFGGDKPPINVCGLSVLTVEPPDLFCNLSQDCKPIATKSRKYSHDDRKFIKNELQRLLTEGIVEPSTSPWRAQVVVTKDDNHKKG